MADWELIIDDETFPDAPRPHNAPPRPRNQWRWGWVAGAIAIFLVAGYLVVQSRRAERQAAIQVDLTAQIFDEEAARSQHDESRIPSLIIPDPPQPWQEDYRRMFAETGQPVLNTIDVQSADFDGRCALVTVALNELDQVRNYCLHEDRWRRAPVPDAAWGIQPAIIPLPQGIQLKFFERDRLFAEALADDLTEYLEHLDGWGLLPVPENIDLTEISIEPGEFQPPLIAKQTDRVVINSPYLNLFSEGLGGQALARKSLAQALATSYLMPTEMMMGRAHNPSLYAWGLQVLAFRFLLDAEGQDKALDYWRPFLKDDDSSSFLWPGLTTDDPSQARLRGWFTVDYVAEAYGIETLASTIKQLPETKNLDDLFETNLGVTTFTLTRRAMVYARDGLDATATVAPLTAPPLPLSATYSRFDKTNARIMVDWTETEHTLMVETTANPQFVTPTGLELGPECFWHGIKPTLEIEGEWLEEFFRLRATRMTIQAVALPELALAPTDAIALLLEEEQGVPTSLIALRRDGTLDYLTAIWPGVQVFPLPIAGGQAPHFLFVLDPNNCQQRWIARYDTGRGFVNLWLAPSQKTNWVWRPDQGDLILVSRPARELGARLLLADNRSYLPHPLNIDNDSPGLGLMGWSVTNQQLIMTRYWVGESQLRHLDVGTGREMALMRPRYQPPRSRRLSADGQWLAYLTGVKNFLGAPDTLDIFDLTGDREPVLFQLDNGDGFGPPVWSAHLGHQQVALLAGPIGVDDRLQPERLYLIDLSSSTPALEVVAQAVEGERLLAPVLCSDGALLYVAVQNGTYRLRRQLLQSRAQTIYESGRPFRAVACP